MTLKIKKYFSKETGRPTGYAIERRVFPFVWKELNRYSDMHALEHDIVWLLKTEGKIREEKSFV